MSLSIRVSGTWRTITKLFDRISGAWYPMVGMWTRVAGVWRLIYTAINVTGTPVGNDVSAFPDGITMYFYLLSSGTWRIDRQIGVGAPVTLSTGNWHQYAGTTFDTEASGSIGIIAETELSGALNNVTVSNGMSTKSLVTGAKVVSINRASYGTTTMTVTLTFYHRLTTSVLGSMTVVLTVTVDG